MSNDNRMSSPYADFIKDANAALTRLADGYEIQHNAMQGIKTPPKPSEQPKQPPIQVKENKPVIKLNNEIVKTPATPTAETVCKFVFVPAHKQELLKVLIDNKYNITEISESHILIKLGDKNIKISPLN